MIGQVNAHGIGVDAVLGDDMTDGRGILHHHPVQGVVGDQVVGTDDIFLAANADGVDIHSPIAIAQGGGTAGVGADMVASDGVAAAIDIDTRDTVAREEVPFDEVALRVPADQYPGHGIAHGVGTARIGADVVARDQVADGTKVANAHAPAEVAGDEIAVGGRIAADAVVLSPPADQDSVVHVG